MTSTFDGSTPAGLPAAPPPPYAAGAPAPEPEVEGTDLGMSALDQLRQRVNDAAAVKEHWVHEIRRTGVRITCDTNIEAADFQRWQTAALPRVSKRGPQRMPDVTKMRRELVSARAILGTCVLVEMKGSDGTYREVTNPRTREPLMLNDPEFLTAFSVPDPIELVRKVFVRDSDLMLAGEDLLTAAGFMGGDDDDEADPT